MRGQTLGLVLHLQRRVEDRGAADGQAAAAAGAVAHRRVEGVAVTDDDLVEVHAEMIGDDLGKGRLVTLAVADVPVNAGTIPPGPTRATALSDGPNPPHPTSHALPQPERGRTR